jgi:hypothetical protein
MPPALFETREAERIRLAGYLDRIDERYGEYVIHPASMMGQPPGNVPSRLRPQPTRT